jgi:hypothetical protein
VVAVNKPATTKKIEDVKHRVLDILGPRCSI